MLCDSAKFCRNVHGGICNKTHIYSENHISTACASLSEAAAVTSLKTVGWTSVLLSKWLPGQLIRTRYSGVFGRRIKHSGYLAGSLVSTLHVRPLGLPTPSEEIGQVKL